MSVYDIVCGKCGSHIFKPVGKETVCQGCGYVLTGDDINRLLNQTYEKGMSDRRDKIISELAEKYDLLHHEIESVLKIVEEDFGVDTLEKQVDFAEKEIFAHLEPS